MYTEEDITPEKQIQWYNRIKADNTKIYWIIRFKGEYIGVINLYDINQIHKRCYWGFYIGDDNLRGKGLGLIIECNLYDYVFNQLKLNKLCCEVFKFNEEVIKLHERCGSKIEGIFVEHIYKNNKFYDIVSMAILKNEWENKKKTMRYPKISIEY